MSRISHNNDINCDNGFKHDRGFKYVNDINEANNVQKNNDQNKIITIQKLSKCFGHKEVLKNVSVTVNRGEIFGLLGPSGAGKTTLIKILTGQLKFEGRAEIMNQSCLQLGRDIYDYIGIQLDNCGIYERLSCYDNLRLFTRIHGIDQQMIKQSLDFVGLERGAGIAGKLSKGMLQRLVLARAILHSPRILFLDEPTGGLDPTNTKKIHDLLLTLKKQGVTIFLTTHNMEEAYKLCDHIALLNNGAIVEFGRPEALCRKYNQDNLITVSYRDQTVLTVKNEPENAGLIAAAIASGQVESLHSSEPNLEMVFIKLTGRGLTDVNQKI